jgi:RHS repeat-associated protein
MTVASNGIWVAELRYKAWGETRYSSGTTPTSFRYTGQRQEESLGIYQMGARWYDPALGRFLSPDSIIPDPANPQSLNRYSYTVGNPLRFVDPTGHFTEEELVNSGAYTAEELRWLAENQTDWYNYLIQAAVGDAFAFAHEGAVGLGQFLLDDNERLYIGGGFWTAASGVQTKGSFQQWGDAIGQAAIQTGILAPEDRIFPSMPNPHVHLSSQGEETNAQIVLGIDIASAVVSLFGYGFMVADTLACPVDPSGKLFGYAVTQVGSAVATFSLVDALITSGPNSRGFTVSLTTYIAGWSSLPLWAPLDLAAAGSQVGYDIYTC